ncbi:MAG: DUF4446 family protein [Armatimonadetes bacterium]|nr:DUF4446 family protein [Armatimonadota bacterium]
MPLTSDSLILYLLVATGALVIAVVAMALRLRGLSRQVAAAGGDPAFVERVAALQREVGAAARQIEHLGGRVDRLGEQAQRSLQHTGLVRYDAFKELGGHLSFSLALLDARRDGVVLSVLNDRDGARGYAKPVTGGRSTYTLSEEEQRAIDEA